MHLKTILASVLGTAVGVKTMLGGGFAASLVAKTIVGLVMGGGCGSAILAAATIADATNFSIIIGIMAGGLGGAIGAFCLATLTGWAKGRAAMRKIEDESRKDSLSAQLEESNSNQEKMRSTLHDIKDQLNVINMENHFLHDALQSANGNFNQANDNFLRVSRELSVANKKNDELRKELFDLKGVVSQVGRDETLHHHETQQLVGETKQLVDETKQTVDETKQTIDRATADFPAVIISQLNPQPPRPDDKK